MQKLKLRTVFIAFVTLALTLLTVVSTLININQFSGLYYGQTEREYLPNSVGRIAEQVRSQLMHPITLSENLAANSLLHNWMQQGETAAANHQQVLAYFKQLQQDGWQVELIYLALPNTEVSRLRVAERVSHGGHNIPLSDIKRRFPRSLSNLLNEYSSLVDFCQCYFNADEEPILIFEQRGNARLVHQAQLFALLVEESNHV